MRAHSAAAQRPAAPGPAGSGCTVCRPSAQAATDTPRAACSAASAVGGRGQARRPPARAGPAERRRSRPAADRPGRPPRRRRLRGSRRGGRRLLTASDRTRRRRARSVRPGASRPTMVCPSPGRSSRSLGAPRACSAWCACTDSATGTLVSRSPCTNSTGEVSRSRSVIGESAVSRSRSATGSPYSVTEAAAIHGSVPAKKVRRSLIPAPVTPGGEQVRPPGQGHQRQVAAVGPAVRADPAGLGDARGRRGRRPSSGRPRRTPPGRRRRRRSGRPGRSRRTRGRSARTR